MEPAGRATIACNIGNLQARADSAALRIAAMFSP